MQSNARAINMLYCVISEEEYKNISTCETAKDIWDRLKNIHGDTNKVKEIELKSTLEESKSGEDREDLAVILRTEKKRVEKSSIENLNPSIIIKRTARMKFNNKRTYAATNVENIELVLNDLEKVLKEYNKLRKEKKNWEIQLEEYDKLRNEKKDWDIQLEEYQLENNLLQEENFEFRKQISSLHKSYSHYFDRSKSSPWLNIYQSTKRGSTDKCPTLNKLTEGSSKSTNKAATGILSPAIKMGQ
ncbi:uncharacterized protein [Nicotiana tomentosiformis]|uniref:uncharacterized protein n=1 Tax=Nicotiana tomentosiformis TaxID=4098 RepID=UPI00388CAFBD